MKVRKRPVEVEAIQWIGTPESDQAIKDFGCEFLRVGYSEKLLINTLEGNITCSIGDWVIKGVKGEFYPCRSDIFEDTYEVLHD